jgi:hypothetical protein
MADCSPAVSGLVSWWPGDGNTNDIAGTNNATLQGGATATGAGMVGQAFTFDGTNNFVQIPDSPSLRPTNLTVEAWVLFTSLDSAGSGAPPGEQYIVFRQNSRSGNFEGFYLGKTRLGSTDVFGFQATSAAGVNAECDGTTAIATNVWYHVAGVRTPTSLQIFVNGRLEGSAAISFPQDYGNFPLYFGTTGQSWDRRFKGRLDEVSLYNRGLSSNEIAAIYAAGSAGKCKAPNITVQPQSQTVLVGTNVTFTVSATGFGVLHYQWQFNSTNLLGATNSTLILTNVQLANGGNYQVVVTNSLGSATSSVAALTVRVPPSFATQPQSATNLVGTTASFTSSASGTPAPSYQWRFNGVPISGATGPGLSIPNVQLTNAGNYTVVATNAAGIATSAVAVLTVWALPSFSAQPQSATYIAGTTANFSASASGTPAPGYQWQFNGVPISGATSSSYSIPNVQLANAGNYTVVASSSAGSVTSSVAVLTVWVLPSITAQPQSTTNIVGTTANFSAGASGTPAPGYQWQFNGVPISGATSSSYSIPNVQLANAGNYTVVASSSAGSVTSSVAVLTVWVLPSINAQPQSTTNIVGTTANFSANASGTPAPAYQWQFNGTDIPGATAPGLPISSVQLANAGNYTVIASNSVGSVTSSVAVLTPS